MFAKKKILGGVEKKFRCQVLNEKGFRLERKNRLCLLNSSWQLLGIFLGPVVSRIAMQAFNYAKPFLGTRNEGLWKLWVGSLRTLNCKRCTMGNRQYCVEILVPVKKLDRYNECKKNYDRPRQSSLSSVTSSAT